MKNLTCFVLLMAFIGCATTQSVVVKTTEVTKLRIVNNWCDTTRVVTFERLSDAGHKLSQPQIKRLEIAPRTSESIALADGCYGIAIFEKKGDQVLRLEDFTHFISPEAKTITLEAVHSASTS